MSLPFVPRDEDRNLLAGMGRFIDDGRLADEAQAVFVRSPHGFADIRGSTPRRRWLSQACSPYRPPPTWNGPVLAM
jgi:hypothetical protein